MGIHFNLGRDYPGRWFHPTYWAETTRSWSIETTKKKWNGSILRFRSGTLNPFLIFQLFWGVTASNYTLLLRSFRNTCQMYPPTLSISCPQFLLCVRPAQFELQCSLEDGWPGVVDNCLFQWKWNPWFKQCVWKWMCTLELYRVMAVYFLMTKSWEYTARWTQIKLFLMKNVPAKRIFSSLDNIKRY